MSFCWRDSDSVCVGLDGICLAWSCPMYYALPKANSLYKELVDNGSFTAHFLYCIMTDCMDSSTRTLRVCIRFAGGPQQGCVSDL